MKTTFKIIASLTFSLLATACLDSGNSGIKHFSSPQRMLIASEDVTFEGTARRLSYISNFSGGNITIMDIRNRRIIDTDSFDDEETPLTVGGTPTEIFEWRPSGLDSSLAYKVVVLEAKNKRLFIVDAKEITDSKGVNTLTHVFADLGGAEIVTAGTPAFFDRGSLSDPTISDISVDPAKTVPENWRLTSNGKGRWQVEGSVSGIQTNYAFSNTPYTSDGGEVSFTIFEGQRLSTDNDTFFFGTIKAKPFTLNGTPGAAQLLGDNLYVADNDNHNIDVIDLNTLSVTTQIALNDGSGNPVVASDMQSNGTKLVVANRGAGQSLQVVDLSDNTVQSFNIGIASQRLLTRAGGNEVFIMPINSFAVAIFDLNSNTLQAATIPMANLTISAALLNGDEGVSGNALFVNQNNAIDLVDLDSHKRVDTRDNGDTESFASQILFFDQGGDSNPSLSDIITQDGITKTESWVMIYEGIIKDSPGTTGNVTGQLLDDPMVTFSTLKLRVGDLVIFSPDDPSLSEELAITEITTDNKLMLASTPTHQGAALDYVIRANKAYTISGNRSGFQTNRGEEGKSGQSDGGEITFSISPATLTTPTSRDDYFSFDTNDGITPIASSGDYGVDIKVFEKKAYVVNQNSNNISMIGIASFDEDTVIN